MTFVIDETIYLTLIVFGLKLLDCTFNTFKTVYMYKNKYMLSAALNTISNVFYLIAIVQIAKATDGLYGIIAVALATFLGTWAPAAFLKKMEPDKMFVYEITSTTMENGKEYADKEKLKTENKYNELNQLITTKTDDLIVTNEYNAEGLRISKEVKNIVTVQDFSLQGHKTHCLQRH